MSKTGSVRSDHTLPDLLTPDEVAAWLRTTVKAVYAWGHSTLSMTLRYMHLAPSALCEAIGLLNFGQPVGSAESAAV